MSPSRDLKLPDLWAALVILGFLLGLELVLWAAFHDLTGPFRAGDPAAVAVVTLLANGIVFTVIMRVTGLTYPELFHRSQSSVQSVLLVLAAPIALVVVAANWWFADLCNLVVPWHLVTEAELESLGRMVDSGLTSLITVCVIAPVLEEMLFRGVLLRGFLSHYRPAHAIVLSAVVFALFHLNLLQLPYALGLGCFIGWLYWRTASLWPCILAHALYNLTVLAAAQHRVGELSATPPGIAGDAVSFALSALGMYLLWRLLERPRPA